MYERKIKNLIIKAEEGDLEAMVMVADCYKQGIETEVNQKYAHQYYKKAVDGGHVKVSFMVAVDYLCGETVPKNKSIGEKYLKYAADNGMARAQSLLAALCEDGDIRALFNREQLAMKYYEMAAEQGYAEAQIGVADLILGDKGSRYSLEDAIFWLVCAYLHHLNGESMKESDEAKGRLQFLIDSGLPGGKARVDKIISDVKNNYLMYTKEPK